jgi:hypothetical protein
MSDSILLNQQVFQEILLNTLHKVYENENLSIYEVLEEIKSQLINSSKELAVLENS